ncbi:thioredoxin family protein [Virgibacillus senegalensis]|uniref:thioredoxin family protein n=1 Tax=Virgibacillus senegalensis TaxID=1499679 RepID=UPI00069D922E|nr:thioredoxin family protein [Virgibacillus senegalensis]
MLQISDERKINELAKGFVFIHTPFCGTCKVARKMLSVFEQMEGAAIFYEMNASLFPDFMQNHQIESVPCLLILADGCIQEKIYAFQSLMHIQVKVSEYMDKKE